MKREWLLSDGILVHNGIYTDVGYIKNLLDSWLHVVVNEHSISIIQGCDIHAHTDQPDTLYILVKNNATWL